MLAVCKLHKTQAVLLYRFLLYFSLNNKISDEPFNYFSSIFYDDDDEETLQTAPTFAIHYNAVKRTFYIPGVSQQFVTETIFAH